MRAITRSRRVHVYISQSVSTKARSGFVIEFTEVSYRGQRRSQERFQAPC